MTLASFYADEDNHVIPFDGIVLFPAWHVKHPQARPRPWSSLLSPTPKADIIMPLLGGGDYQMQTDIKPKGAEDVLGKTMKTIIPVSKKGQGEVPTQAQISGDAVDVLPVPSVIDPPIDKTAAEVLSVHPSERVGRTRFTRLRRFFCLGHSRQDN